MLTVCYIRVEEYNMVLEERMLLDRSIDLAVDAGVKEFIVLEDETLDKKRDNAVQVFFQSLHSALGILDSEDTKQKINLYIPMIAIIDDTGFYINYGSNISDNNGHKNYERRWTYRIPFVYEDKNLIFLFSLKGLITVYDKGNILSEAFGVNVIQCTELDLFTNEEYEGLRKAYKTSFHWSQESFTHLKKELITKKLEEYMNYYVNEHNEIAKEFGITYQFFLPSLEASDFLRSIESESMIALFQGYPLNSAQMQYYNRLSVAGASLYKEEHFYIEKKDWYYLYHRSDCSRITTFNNEISFTTREDCASFGAFACEECN